VADDLSTNGLPRQGALAVGTAETLHRRDLVDARTNGFKLSLKLYHQSELRLGYQQSIAEAPRLELAKDHTVATCNRYLASLKAAYSLAMKNEKVERNPVKDVRLQKENNKRVRWLTIEEEARLFVALPIQWHPLVLVALHTGLRRGELLGLRWEDVNFQQRFITARKTKAGDTRQVPMNDVALEALIKIPRRLDNEYVFPGIKSFHLINLPRGWKRYVKNAQLEDFRWHDLRHTFASRLVMAGVDLYTVKKLLGHHDLTMTERYAHLAPHYLKRAVDNLTLSPSPTAIGTATS
jgi:integrase